MHNLHSSWSVIHCIIFYPITSKTVLIVIIIIVFQQISLHFLLVETFRSVLLSPSSGHFFNFFRATSQLLHRCSPILAVLKVLKVLKWKFYGFSHTVGEARLQGFSIQVKSSMVEQTFLGFLIQCAGQDLYRFSLRVNHYGLNFKKTPPFVYYCTTSLGDPGIFWYNFKRISVDPTLIGGIALTAVIVQQ